MCAYYSHIGKRCSEKVNVLFCGHLSHVSSFLLCTIRPLNTLTALQRPARGYSVTVSTEDCALCRCFNSLPLSTQLQSTKIKKSKPPNVSTGEASTFCGLFATRKACSMMFWCLTDDPEGPVCERWPADVSPL